MKRSAVAVGIALGLMAAAAVGYLAGSRSERASGQAAVSDATASKTLIVVRWNIGLLTEVRQKKYPDLIEGLEMWTIVNLQTIDPATFIKGSASDYLYPQTLEMMDGY